VDPSSVFTMKPGSWISLCTWWMWRMLDDTKSPYYALLMILVISRIFYYIARKYGSKSGIKIATSICWYHDSLRSVAEYTNAWNDLNTPNSKEAGRANEVWYWTCRWSQRNVPEDWPIYLGYPHKWTFVLVLKMGRVTCYSINI